MITAPIVVPVLQNSSSSSYTQKCLERPELSDLYKKALNQEQFTDEDAERLTKCIGESKEATAKILAITLFVLIVVIVAVCLLIFLT